MRLTLWYAAATLADGSPGTEHVATAKFWAAEAGHQVAHTAVHIHGGIGIDTDSPCTATSSQPHATNSPSAALPPQLRALARNSHSHQG